MSFLSSILDKAVIAALFENLLTFFAIRQLLLNDGPMPVLPAFEKIEVIRKTDLKHLFHTPGSFCIKFIKFFKIPKFFGS